MYQVTLTERPLTGPGKIQKFKLREAFERDLQGAGEV